MQIENPAAERNPATAHLFIINPLTHHGIDNLFSTHPATENRIAALERLAIEMGRGGHRPARPALRLSGPRSANPGATRVAAAALGVDGRGVWPTANRRRREQGTGTLGPAIDPAPRRDRPPIQPGRCGRGKARPTDTRSSPRGCRVRPSAQTARAPGVDRPASPRAHRRRHHRRRAAPRAGRSTSSSTDRAAHPDFAARPDRDRRAAVRMLGDRRCAGSGRCVICSGASARTRPSRTTRRGSKPPSLHRRRADPAGSMCPTMPPSTSRCGWCRPTIDARALCRPGQRRAAPAIARDGAHDLAAIDTTALDTPDWLMARWIAALGRGDRARHRASPTASEPALDLTVQDDPEALGERRSAAACCRPARCARIAHGPIAAACRAIGDGAWWVQDAAAALPAQLLGDVRGQRVADLCAAPGGKTAQLAAAGAARDRGRPLAAPGSSGSRQNLAAPAAHGRDSSPPMSRSGRPDRSTPSCSMRPARPPAPSAAIRTSRGSSARPISPRSRRLQRRLHRARRRAAQAGRHRWSIAPARWSRTRASADRPRPPRPRLPACSASRSQPAEVGGLAELVDRRRRPAHLPCHLPDADPRMGGLDGFYAARLRRI